MAELDSKDKEIRSLKKEIRQLQECVDYEHKLYIAEKDKELNSYIEFREMFKQVLRELLTRD